jgi:hypothetical protein
MDTTNAAATARETMDKARDVGHEALNKGQEAIEQGYEKSREYVSQGLDYAGEVSDSMAEFVQRQPWLALAGAFVIGYVAAKAIRHL